ncbi:MAG: TetR/AcrR family transcriptional regulator [Halieaceae bacterium]
MSLRQLKKQATAQEILAAAKTLFLQQGFQATRMPQIAAAAGVSRASLFNYYPGKQAILEALAAEMETRLVQLVAHYREKYPLAPEALARLFAYAGQVLDQTAGLTRLLYLEGNRTEGNRANSPTDLQTQFASLVAAGQRGGQWRNDLSADALGETLYLGFIAGLLDWCREQDSPPQSCLSARADTLNALLARPQAG